MPAYRFEALNAAGKTVNGLVEADTPKAARTQLRGQQLVPLKVDPVTHSEGEASRAGQMFTRRVFNATALTIWTRQLSGLVVAGLPLERALTALSDEAEDPRQRELVSHLRAEVNAGSTFARALGSAPREFDEVYRGVVAAGEQSGQLGSVLDKLANDLEEQQALTSKLIGATLYPAIVSVFAVVIVVALLVFVVPQVAQVFSSSKRALPMLTQFMLGLSAFMRQWGWLLGLALIGGSAGLVWARRLPDFRLRFDAFWLTLPVIGRLAKGYNAARFAGTLAMLAGSGVPILKALQAAAETLSNRAMRADAMDCLDQVREGAPLASALAAKKRFPGLLAMFARLGEQTGQLPVMLQRAANQLSAEVTRKALAIATILEPLLIVAMGLVVMLIVMSVMLPIMQMNTWVK
ncbi:MAG: type II secretion system inner membrane protein GspF [Aquabacterium sp.]|jgi:general secretion pathway protein F|uniref:type II secretion system inner membrane protein GspF n=1 Tax=Aquabacterium sp. TaxID=1872578 RepID=UPI001B3E18C9|nr:type II secretion system inner membrane protein GspF [Aquabacterium sp.]MBP7131964.1 type II secretion system inner membrane protein GspF [Aquabacterium sp.]MBP9063686.1 type II secretion system inner membrane protein GspF [Aquabacterium sp.]MDQ5926309.1 ral secretion pathway protein [Pseudomonadota bacterium]